MKGLLVLAGAVVVLTALRVGLAAQQDAYAESPAGAAGYLQVREDGAEYIFEMDSERMRVEEIAGAAGEGLLVESGDALEISLSGGGDRVVRVVPRGMDNPTRYILGLKMDLNRASAFDMSLVPGLGLVRAERIFARRESRGGYSNWDDVMADPEMTQDLLLTLKEWFYLADVPAGDGG